MLRVAFRCSEGDGDGDGDGDMVAIGEDNSEVRDGFFVVVGDSSITLLGRRSMTTEVS